MVRKFRLAPYEARTLYDSGWTTGRIAARAGVSRQRVHEALRRTPGFVSRGHDDAWLESVRGAARRRCKPVNVAKAVALFEAGKSVREIARRLGVSDETVKRRLVEAGRWRQRHRWATRTLTDADVREIRARLARKQTWAAIAERVGVSKGMIGHIKHGRWPR